MDKKSKIDIPFRRLYSSLTRPEIPTKYLLNKRARDAGKEPPRDNKCRLCKTNVEDVIHIISCCPFMSARYYLPMRHDMVAKTLYKEIIKRTTQKSKLRKKLMNKSTYKN